MITNLINAKQNCYMRKLIIILLPNLQCYLGYFGKWRHCYYVISNTVILDSTFCKIISKAWNIVPFTKFLSANMNCFLFNIANSLCHLQILIYDASISSFLIVLTRLSLINQPCWEHKDAKSFLNFEAGGICSLLPLKNEQ